MKTKTIPSAVPIYIAAAVWPVFSLVIKPTTVWGLLLLAAFSAAGYFVGKRFFPGETVEAEEVLRTGDDSIDMLISDSQKALRDLREANKALDAAEITQKLDRMDDAGTRILKAVAEKPERASQVRRFMQYYLPMTAKLLEQYRRLYDTNITGGNIEKGMKSVENSLDLIAVAFEKQLDVLYKDEALDMSTDVSVLETMIKSDGLTDEGITNILKGEVQHG
ncbi:MAG: 5-bromo-4-chloroindolyl phosphate hydrolysis family protein [Christensenellales bacterium]|jgi:5-bromo-4-chloroindolyl phosphate hydrolysis protein